jgi:preprotein translocase subunit SecE
MNRETKRAMARQQRTTDQGQRLQQMRKQQAVKQQQAVKSAGAGRGGGRGLRSITRFGSEVISELKKVNWPDRRTVAGYTVVVLVSVSIITAIIFGLDYLFGQAIVALYT